MIRHTPQFALNLFLPEKVQRKVIKFDIDARNRTVYSITRLASQRNRANSNLTVETRESRVLDVKTHSDIQIEDYLVCPVAPWYFDLLSHSFFSLSYPLRIPRVIKRAHAPHDASARARRRKFCQEDLRHTNR